MQLEQEVEESSKSVHDESVRRTKVIQPPSLSPAIVVSNLRELWWYRDLLYTLTEHRIKVRYKQSALGFAWALLQPLSLMMIYTVIFSLFTRIPSEHVNYSLFVLAAILPWTFFQTSISSASSGLVSHTQLITKVYFPREILPITYVLAALFDFVIASLILATMMAWYRVRPTPEILFVIPILCIAVCFASSLALILSALQVRFRDIGIAMPLLLQLWMFASPVVYPLSEVPVRFRSYYIWNPLVGVVENFRRVVVQGIGPDLSSLLISAGVTAVALPAAYIYFKRREATMADII